MPVDPFEADQVLTVKMPSGTFSFTLEVKTKKWTTYKGYVQFETRLKTVPSRIQFSNADFDGVADLYVTSITRNGFYFRVSTDSGGVNSASFDWEAIL